MSTSALRRAHDAGTGVAAVAAGAGLGHLTAALVEPGASPVLAVGSNVIDLAPAPVKEWAVATFGTADKPLLLGSVVLVTLCLAAGAGLLGRRRPGLGAAVLAALAALATVAAITRPAAGPMAVVPGLVTAATGVLIFLGLHERRASMRAQEVASGEAGPTRRSMLAVPLIAVLGAAAAAAGQRLNGAQEALRRALPTARRAAPAMPAGLERTISTITPLRTADKDFYRVDTALTPPRVDPQEWRLVVDGEVEHPFSLSYDELVALPLVERHVTLTCVSNQVGGEYAGGATWLGYPVRDLLLRAGVRPGNDQVLSTSVDGFTCSTPLKALQDDREALVAVGMNGEALSRVRGFPARLITPGLYGYVGATKWVTRLTVTTYDAKQAYWTQRGWAEQGPIKTMARIDTPGGLGDIKPGRTAVAGVAWAQGRGVERVEVQIDNGPWRTATLGPDVNIDYWRQWYLPWDATTGAHTIRARAVDGTGAVQSPDRAKPFPNGAAGWHTASVDVS